MDPNIRYLGVGAGFRALGLSLVGPFLGLFLHNVLGWGYLEVALLIVVLGTVPIPVVLLGGLVTDRVGRRNVFLLTIAGEAGSMGLLALGMAREAFPLVLLGALLGGLAANLGGPAISAYVADYAAGSERTLGFTWFRVGHNAGFAAGVAAGGLLLPLLGFSTVAALSAVVVALGVVTLALLLDPSPYDRRLKAVPAGGPTPESRRPRRPSMLQSLRYLAKDRAILSLGLAFFFGSMIIGQWGNTLTLYANGPLHIPYAWLGLGLALNGLVVVFGQTLTTRGVLGYPLTTIFLAGLLLYVLAFLALGLAGLLPDLALAIFFPAVLVLTVGENLTSITSSTLPSNLAPTGELGSYNGAAQTASTLGNLAAIVLGGAALAWIADPLVLWGALSVPALPALYYTLRSRRGMAGKADRA